MILPSLLLLLMKTAGIFLLSWLAGWAISWRRSSEHAWIECLTTTVVGATALTLLVASAIVLNIPGAFGPLILLPLTIAKAFSQFNKTNFYAKNFTKKIPFPFLLISAAVALNYLAPFVQEGTSGLYSRGGGDHSTYLALSEYFQSKGLWDIVDKEETIPPLPYWESKTYPNSLQNLFAKLRFLNKNELQPLGNQVIDTAFMSALPGEADETYTAGMAFYAAIAVASTIALIFALQGGWAGVAWLAFTPIVLSNLLLYPTGTHSTPFLFAISMLNVSLLLAWQMTQQAIYSRQFLRYMPAIVCGGGLLTIYPFLFLVLGCFYALFAIYARNGARLTAYFKLGLFVIAGSVILTNFYLLINIPLVLFGTNSANSLYHSFTLAQLFSTQSGLVDFLMLPADGSISPTAGLSILAGITCVALAFFGCIRRRGKDTMLLAAVATLFLAGALYFNLRDADGSGGYQMVRLATLSHLYLLGLAGIGLMELIRDTRWRAFLGIVLVVLYAVFAIYQRIKVVREVVGTPNAFATEFRDSDAYRIRAEVEDIQRNNASSWKNRTVYYFGHGDGTDFAGATVFMRPLWALNAFNLETILENAHGQKLWDRDLIGGALLIYAPVDQREIIKDSRVGAAMTPILSSKRLVVWDTTTQNTSAVVGESWNYPIPYDVGLLKTSFRYLRGRTGALVIWADQESQVNLDLKIAADAEGGILHLKELSSAIETNHSVNFWRGDYQDKNQTTDIKVTLKLNPGPNIIELTPRSNDGKNPWLLVFNIKIDDN